MRATERRIYHFDLEVKRHGHTDHLPSLLKLLEVWKEKADDHTALQSRLDGDLIYGVSKVEYYNTDQACIRVYVNDKHSPDAVYGDFVTGVAERKNKGATQGGMHSAHIVVSVTPYKADTYHCIIEHASKLNQTNIQLLLNKVLNVKYDEDKTTFTYDDPSGRRTKDKQIKKIPFLPRVELKAYPSEELLKSLSTGEIRGITLSMTHERSEFGGSEFLVEHRRHMTVKVKPGFPRDNRKDTIIAAARRDAPEYDKIRISFTDPRGEVHSVDFNSSDGTVIDSRNVKNELLWGITPPLADASTEIVPRLLRPMLERLRARQGG